MSALALYSKSFIHQDKAYFCDSFLLKETYERDQPNSNSRMGKAREIG